ncbi:MAG: Peptidase fungalysin, partial [Pedosphaera sp.]|nr:Peptidase fungalysin [Pedosphaera sp.]
MKPRRQLVALIAFALLAGRTFAFLPPAKPPLPNLDARNQQAIEESTLSADRSAALSGLRLLVPNVKVDFEPVTRAPKQISSLDGFLTGPAGLGRGVSAAALTAIPADDPHRIAKAFLREHSGLFGYGAEALDESQARVNREFTTQHNGMTTVVWEQSVDGVPVFEALLIAHTTRQGELVSIGSQFVVNPRL